MFEKTPKKEWDYLDFDENLVPAIRVPKKGNRFAFGYNFEWLGTILMGLLQAHFYQLGWS
jgi:hypothetical protein